MPDPSQSNSAETLPGVGFSDLLSRATLFEQLAQSHRRTGSSCERAGLPPEIGEYERGKADAYDVCASVFRHLAKRDNEKVSHADH